MTIEHFPEGLGALPAISLSDLQRQAAFLTRQDRKYVVLASAVEDMLASIERTTRVLEIDGRRTFCYKTPCFDDDDLASYFSALRRRSSRFKVRTRHYVDSGLCQLEVKLRDGRGRTVKHRIDHETGCLDHLSEGDRAWLRTFPQVEHYAACLRHCITTFYRRSTLMLPGGAGRVTIDRDLVFALPNGQEVAVPTMAIIETKVAGKATAFDRVLWRTGHRPRSMSKFTIGLGLLLPELPANRWHRLRMQLAAVAEESTTGAGRIEMLPEPATFRNDGQ